MIGKLAAIAACLATVVPACAQSVTAIPTEAPVTAVIQTPRGSFIETERGTYRVLDNDVYETSNGQVVIDEDRCFEFICIVPDVIRGLPERAPEGGLPDGFVATANNGDILKAWYARPTDRYGHGVLGDAIEGGSLVVELADGTQKEFVLPDDQVFEDLTPRLHDFYFDGKSEIVTIRSSASGGAAVVIYALQEGELREIAASSENGRANRWLNIVGIVTRDYLKPSLLAAKPPFNEYQVLFVRTPHINGRLSSLSLQSGKIVERNRIATGFSNHVIGSRVLGMYAHLPTKDGGEGYVPSQDRKTLVPLTGRMQEVPLPAPIDKAIIALDNHLVTATEDGRLLSIKP